MPECDLRELLQTSRFAPWILPGPRQIAGASRKWYLYGFYSPEMDEKMLTIFRTYFNFIAKGQDVQTPAMRLGLAKGPVRFEDVIYFF